MFWMPNPIFAFYKYKSKICKKSFIINFKKNNEKCYKINLMCYVCPIMQLCFKVRIQQDSYYRNNLSHPLHQKIKTSCQTFTFMLWSFLDKKRSRQGESFASYLGSNIYDSNSASDNSTLMPLNNTFDYPKKSSH